jgi:hypothetical protein
MAEVNGNGSGAQPHANGTVPIMNGATSYAAKHKLADHFIGGNKLENAAPGKVKDFVANHDGHTVITKVSQLQSGGYTRIQLKAKLGPDCQQWYCSSQGDSIGTKMGLRNLWRRASYTIHSHGHTRRFAGKRRLYPNGRSVC